MQSDPQVNIDLDLEGERTETSPEPSLRLIVASVCGYTRDGGAPTITRDCADVAALEREATRLKAEIDTALERARGHFVAATERAQTAARAKRSAEAARAQRSKQQLPTELTVGDVMTTDVRTVGPNDRLVLADELMNVGRFRHVVVVDDAGAVVGVVSRRDIFHGALSWSLGQGRTGYDKLLQSCPVKQVMASSIVTTTSGAKLADAAERMMQAKLGCLPVVDGDDLVGILTEGDFLALLATRSGPSSATG